jgi:hypothetical protein
VGNRFGDFAVQRREPLPTVNGDDFTSEIHKFLAQTKRNECHVYGEHAIEDFERDREAVKSLAF